ncbi:MAG: hypothetical protein ACFNKJ_01055 [Rothia dentocariosa]
MTVARNIKGRVRRPADSSVLSNATAKFGSNSLQRERVSTDSLPVSFGILSGASHVQNSVNQRLQTIAPGRTL